MGSYGSYINNYNDNEVIDAGILDNITNHGKDVIINGGGYNVITNLGDGVIINGGEGGNTITNTVTKINGTKFLINAGSGNDYVKNVVLSTNTNNGTINGGAGNDTIYNISDTIYNSSGVGSDVTPLKINGDEGNDCIYNQSSNVIINAGDGDDTISAVGDYDKVTINTGNGNDLVDFGNLRVVGVKATVNCGNGEDTIKHSGKKNSTNAGASVLVNGTDKDDKISIVNIEKSTSSIHNAGSEAVITVAAGRGNDTITADSWSPDVFKYSPGDGDDVIINFDKTDLIYLTSGNINNSIINGDDVILKIGDGSITLKDATAQTIRIMDTYGNISTLEADSVQNTHEGILITNYANDDTVITGSAGDDTINSWYSKNVKINAAEGNDHIISYGDKVTINGGKGDNYISNSGEDVIINSEDGNDTVQSSNVVENLFKDDFTNITINTSAGNDYIDIYAQNAQIDAGIGNDFINTKFSHSTIKTGGGDDTVVVFSMFTTSSIAHFSYEQYGSTSIVGSSSDDKITIVEDDFSKTRYKTKPIATVNAGKGNDTIAGTKNFVYVYTVGDGDDIVYGFDDDDTIKIAGGEYNTVPSGDDLIINIGSGSIRLVDFHPKYTRPHIEQISLDDDNVESTTPKGEDTEDETNNTNEESINNSSNNTVIAGTMNNDTIDNYGSYTTINAGSGNDSIDNRYSSNSVVNAGDGNDFISSAGNYNTLDGGAGDDTINGWTSNMFIDGGEGNDSIYTGNYETNVTVFGGAGDDNIISWNNQTLLNGGKGDDIINAYGSSATISYANGDGNDIINGYDSSDTIYLTDNSSYSTIASGNDVIINVGNGLMTLKDAANTTLNIVRETATETATQTTLTLTNADKKTIKADAMVRTIDARARTKATNITANSLGDTIYSGKGADKLNLGTGADVVIYSNGDGKDIIYNYEEKDKIVVESGSIDSIKASGSNILIYVGKGRLTLKNAKGKSITLADANGTTTTQKYDKGVMYFNDTGTSVGKAKTGIYILNASNRTKAIKLTGNAKANTLIGGSGNDTLKGGGGADTFIYSEGNDTITDYTARDELLFNTAINSVTISKKNVIFNTDNGTLTVKNGKGKAVTLTDVNGTKSTQKYNTSSYEATEATEPWFAKDDNLNANDEIKSIVSTDKLSDLLFSDTTSGFDDIPNGDSIFAMTSTGNKNHQAK